MTRRVAMFSPPRARGQYRSSSCRPAPRSGPSHPARSSRARRSGSTRFRTASITRSARARSRSAAMRLDHRQRRGRADRGLAQHAGRRLGAGRAGEDDHRQADSLRDQHPLPLGSRARQPGVRARTWRSSVTNSRGGCWRRASRCAAAPTDMFIGGMPSQIAQLGKQIDAMADGAPKEKLREQLFDAAAVPRGACQRQAAAAHHHAHRHADAATAAAARSACCSWAAATPAATSWSTCRRNAWSPPATCSTRGAVVPGRRLPHGVERDARAAAGARLRHGSCRAMATRFRARRRSITSSRT